MTERKLISFPKPVSFSAGNIRLGANRITTATRGHRFKVLGSRYRGDVRGRFFTQRVVGPWNGLPATVVEADSIGPFKRLLDKYMELSKIEGYR